MNRGVKHGIYLAGMALASVMGFAQQPNEPRGVGELFASDASVRGAMVMTSGGTRVMSGSQVAAGSSAAMLRLTRGGEVRVCPGTSVAVSQQWKAAPIQFGIGMGAMEIQYKLESVSDTIVTPDFRIQLIGPGTFHFALGAAANGDTCVKSLPGQNASIIVNDAMGDGTYQIAAGWSVIFMQGKLKEVYSSDKPCGCPVNPPPQQAPAVQVAANVPVEAKPTPAQPTSGGTGQVVEMEAPLVYSPKATAAGDPELAEQQRVIATLRMRPLPAPLVKELMPSPAPKKGFFGAIGSFFSRLFGGKG